MSTSGEQELFLLLRTKLHTPRIRDDPVARPRLVDRLNGGLDRQLSLIRAPAGFMRIFVDSGPEMTPFQQRDRSGASHISPFDGQAAQREEN